MLLGIIIAMTTPTVALRVRDARHVLFSSRWYPRAQEGPYASIRTFPSFAFETVRLSDVGPFLTFQRRSSSTSSFHAIEAIDGVMSLALRLRLVSQAPKHSRSSEMQTICGVALNIVCNIILKLNSACVEMKVLFDFFNLYGLILASVHRTNIFLMGIAPTLL